MGEPLTRNGITFDREWWEEILLPNIDAENLPVLLREQKKLIGANHNLFGPEIVALIEAEIKRRK
jgi:hypothetical protein